MNRKAVFFDADGTLCDMEKGVPQSTKEALPDNGKQRPCSCLCKAMRHDRFLLISSMPPL